LIAGGVADAFATDTTQRLKALLLSRIIALGAAIIVHDRAPGKVLGRHGFCCAKNCREYNSEQKQSGSHAPTYDHFRFIASGK
jgi:hypothetical protein